MGRQPVLNEPKDILDELTDPGPTAAPPAVRPVSLPEQGRERGGTAAPALSRALPELPAVVPSPQLARPGEDHQAREAAEEARIAGREDSEDDARPPRGRRARPSKVTVEQRRGPNVSIYLSDEQKRTLALLKLDLKLGYTEIILDALKARHPRAKWGS